MKTYVLADWKSTSYNNITSHVVYLLLNIGLTTPFGQNYSEQEITFASVPILLISECFTSYIPLVLDSLKNHEFSDYYTNKHTGLATLFWTNLYRT